MQEQHTKQNTFVRHKYLPYSSYSTDQFWDDSPFLCQCRDILTTKINKRLEFSRDNKTVLIIINHTLYEVAKCKQ